MNYDLTPGKRVGRTTVLDALDNIRKALANASMAEQTSVETDDYRCGQIDYAVGQLMVLQSFAHAQRAINQARKVLP